MESEYKYRRHLPHMQGRGGALFVTFCTHRRWSLPPACRDIMLEHCLRGAREHYELYAAVVMPDHVHLILKPSLIDSAVIPLRKIMNSLKGSSAHAINRELGRRGPVWHNERFDHVLRSNERLYDRALYIANNPVRKGLVREWRQYRWIWMAEGLET